MNKRKLISVFMAIAIVACKQKTAENKTADSTRVLPKPSAAATHLVGVWYDEEIKTEKGEQIAYELVTRGGKTYIQVVAFTGKKLNVPDSPDLSPDATELKKNGERYTSVQSANESYVLDKKTGDLSIYDETGLVVKCKRLL